MRRYERHDRRESLDRIDEGWVKNVQFEPDERERIFRKERRKGRHLIDAYQAQDVLDDT